MPFVKNKLSGDIKTIDIERFIDHLSEYKTANGKSLSNVRKNGIIKAGMIPMRWAYRKGKINKDITQGIILFSSKKKRNILTPDLVSSVFKQEWSDERSKIANLTAMVTGLRVGELQSLLFGDLDNNCLIVRNLWNDYDKLKTTKNNCERSVEFPFPSIMESLKYIASFNPHGCNNNSFIF